MLKSGLALLLALSALSLAAQTATPKSTDTPRPSEANFSKWEDYQDALIDWRIQQNASKVVAPKPATLAACKASLTKSLELNESLKSSLNLTATSSAQANKELEQRIAELAKQYSDALTVLDILNSEIHSLELTAEQKKKFSEVSPGKALDLGISAESGHSDLVKFAVKLRDHDAMAVDKYNSLLGDYKDYVTRVGIQFSQMRQANQTSNALAIYQMLNRAPQTIRLDVADCTKSPALCVH